VGQQTNANGNVWDGQRVEWEKWFQPKRISLDNKKGTEWKGIQNVGCLGILNLKKKNVIKICQEGLKGLAI